MLNLPAGFLLNYVLMPGYYATARHDLSMTAIAILAFELFFPDRIVVSEHQFMKSFSEGFRIFSYLLFRMLFFLTVDCSIASVGQYEALVFKRRAKILQFDRIFHFRTFNPKMPKVDDSSNWVIS